MFVAAELVPIVEPIAACHDSSDDKFPELAVNEHADLIISGDADLLALNPLRNIPIVTPAIFPQGAARNVRRAQPNSRLMNNALNRCSLVR
jgi:predicted nucleic acid-binding protein